ncbi:N-acetylmuramoyl-L-alanine amidase [Kitasatospora sp. NPDC057015]|uniref:N-acetylmuramoyl-L-alanine amidase n=1 Tax=Kitasatospora sp. NPDC057015 TaxID=3346001 RepID=UPI00362E3077
MTGTTPHHPDSPGPFESPEEARPRRGRLLAVTVGGALLPLCFAGWLGWQAVAGKSSDSRPAAASDALAPTGPALPGGSPAAGPGSSLPTAPAQGGTAAAAAAQPAEPAASPSAAAAGRVLVGRTVLLDPGHNTGNSAHTAEINRQVDIGNARKECDTTGTSTNAGYSEAEYTLDVSRRARTILEARGATVVFTQDGDKPWGPCIDQRALAGGAAHAEAAVSVHADGGPAAGSGFHVIMPAKVAAGRASNGAIVAPSHRLGLLLRDSFKAATGEPFADYIASQGLDTRSDLGGLNLSAVPKVFIECGNMRNSGDAQRMTDPQWRQQAAQGIADALTTFLTTPG